MSKSKHPGLLKAAQSNVAEVAKACDVVTKGMKKLAPACGDLKKVCDSSPAALSTQAKYLQGIVGSYTKKVQEIVEVEKESDKAKGDKNRAADVQKKLDKLEREADALRLQYNQGCEVIQAIADAAKAMAASVMAAAGELPSYSVGPA